MSSPVLALSNARFGYRNVVAAHANLLVGKGEVVALVGSNGSGKSTLIKGALGLIDCYGGDVGWFGSPLGQPGRRSLVGYVPQHPPLGSPIPSTLQEMVRTGRLSRAGTLGRHRRIDRLAVSEAISAVGLQAQHRSLVRELSGGQQRRALVARALAARPAALVLDEPFAGVDAASQQLLAEAFQRLIDGGVTLVVALHEIGPLAGIITRVVHLEGGAVAFDGAPQERPAALVRHDPQVFHCDEVSDFDRSRFGLLTR